jgi:hypothetical protein
MSFFSRVVTYLANELIVERLSESRAFQRFALRTAESLKNVRNASTCTSPMSCCQPPISNFSCLFFPSSASNTAASSNQSAKEGAEALNSTFSDFASGLRDAFGRQR